MGERVRMRFFGMMGVAVEAALAIMITGACSSTTEVVPITSPFATTATLATSTATSTGSPGPTSAQEPMLPAPFAFARDLPLFPISRSVHGYAFHESLFDTALELRPTGKAKLVDNDAFKAPQPSGGPSYVVMKTRGRPTPPASAVDVVVPPGSPVQAPVDGVVVNASRYLLYCVTPDQRVVIQPLDHPSWRVVMFHLVNVQVRKGDAVRATETAVGEPHVFVPHSAEYDAYFRGGLPHVHVEVEDQPVVPTPCVRQ